MTRPHIRRNRQTAVIFLTNILLILPYRTERLNSKMKHSVSTANKLETFSMPKIPFYTVRPLTSRSRPALREKSAVTIIVPILPLAIPQRTPFAPMFARMKTIHLPSIHETEVLSKTNLRDLARLLGKIAIAHRATSLLENWFDKCRI